MFARYFQFSRAILYCGLWFGSWIVTGTLQFWDLPIPGPFIGVQCCVSVSRNVSVACVFLSMSLRPMMSYLITVLEINGMPCARCAKLCARQLRCASFFYIAMQCPKLRVHPAPCVHMLAAGCTGFSTCAPGMCMLLLTS